MYGLSECALCHRPRIIDADAESSACPYCGYTQKHKEIKTVYMSEDQNAVREALGMAKGYIPPDSAAKKRRIAEADPYSTMIYNFEHCSNLSEKMEILAEGLTACKGTFTMEDVREIVGKDAERYVSAMLDRCLISEVRIGVYKGRIGYRSSSCLPSSGHRGPRRAASGGVCSRNTPRPRPS